MNGTVGSGYLLTYALCNRIAQYTRNVASLQAWKSGIYNSIKIYYIAGYISSISLLI